MNTIRLLLIDDEEELVSTLVERLEIRGIEAEYVTSGPEAFKLLEEKEFDAVVLDYKLPGMSGIQVMERILESYPKLKIILITGAGSLDEEKEKIPKEKAFDVLLKPVDIDVLIQKLNEAIGG